jgi:sugar-specific transcriptional regulator TrmB
MLIELIKNLGLDENEAKIYLALLELGPSLVTKIGQKAGINRTTCYDVLERLVKYNLVTYASGKQTKKKYSPMPPHNMVSFLERRQKQQEKQLEKLKEKMPELKMLYKEINKPSIKFFEGTEGVKAIYAETLKSKTEILSIGDCEEWSGADLVAWGKNYNRQRAKLRVKERVLIPDSPKTTRWFANYPASIKYTQYKILPKNKINFTFSGEVNIYEDKVVIVLLKSPNRMGIMIESGILVKMLKAMFEMAWISAGKVNKFQKKGEQVHIHSGLL